MEERIHTMTKDNVIDVNHGVKPAFDFCPQFSLTIRVNSRSNPLIILTNGEPLGYCQIDWSRSKIFGDCR